MVGPAITLQRSSTSTPSIQPPPDRPPSRAAAGDGGGGGAAGAASARVAHPAAGRTAAGRPAPPAPPPKCGAASADDGRPSGDLQGLGSDGEGSGGGSSCCTTHVIAAGETAPLSSSRTRPAARACGQVSHSAVVRCAEPGTPAAPKAA